MSRHWKLLLSLEPWMFLLHYRWYQIEYATQFLFCNMCIYNIHFIENIANWLKDQTFELNRDIIEISKRMFEHLKSKVKMLPKNIMCISISVGSVAHEHADFILGGVGTHPDGYVCTNPLHQVPTKQSAPITGARLPPYFRLPVVIPVLRRLLRPAIARVRIPS